MPKRYVWSGMRYWTYLRWTTRLRRWYLRRKLIEIGKRITAVYTAPAAVRFGKRSLLHKLYEPWFAGREMREAYYRRNRLKKMANIERLLESSEVDNGRDY